MKAKFFLCLIIFLAFTLRSFKLDAFPATLYGDEQAFAWNAYNILKLGQDEYGNPYPLQFRSFDDYKAPLPVYLLVPFIKIWGLTPFAIRLSIALVSAVTVLAAYFLTRVFLGRKVSLLATFLLAISPWHIHLSRGFFEAILALLWFILGIYFFLKDKGNLKFLLTSMIFFGLSLYSYFTPRILVPIFLVFLIWYDRRRGPTSLEVGPHKGKVYNLSLIFLVFLSLPLLKLTFLDKGFSRFNKLTATNNQMITETVNRERNTSNLPSLWRKIFHNKATVWIRLVKNNYLEHLSVNFWYIYGDNSLRYFTGNMGMFYLVESVFLIIGLYVLWLEKRSVAIFFVGWILFAVIPASIVGRPFAVRSLAMLPAPFIFVGYGIHKSVSFLKKIKFKVILSLILAISFSFSLGMLLLRYYFEYPVYAATWWGWENKAAIDYARARESDYDQIFISDFYTGATLAFAVYSQYDPLEYRYAVTHPVTMLDNKQLIRLGKYYFGSLDLDKKRLSDKIIPNKSLYIGRPEEPEGEERIVAPDDGRLIFVVHDTLKKN